MGDNTIVFIGKKVLLGSELRAARVVVKDGKIVEVVEAPDEGQVCSFTKDPTFPNHSIILSRW